METTRRVLLCHSCAAERNDECRAAHAKVSGVRVHHCGSFGVHRIRVNVPIDDVPVDALARKVRSGRLLKIIGVDPSARTLQLRRNGRLHREYRRVCCDVREFGHVVDRVLLRRRQRGWVERVVVRNVRDVFVVRGNVGLGNRACYVSAREVLSAQCHSVIRHLPPTPLATVVVRLGTQRLGVVRDDGGRGQRPLRCGTGGRRKVDRGLVRRRVQQMRPRPVFDVTVLGHLREELVHRRVRRERLFACELQARVLPHGEEHF